MTTLASDNFNRADENPVTGFTTVFNALRIVSNQVTTTTAGNENFAFVSSLSAYGDQWSECTIVSIPNDGSGVGPCTRMASGRIGYNTYIDRQNGTAAIIRDDSTLVASVANTFAANDVYRLESVGSTHTLYKNSVSIVSGSDSTYSTGVPGLGGFEVVTAGSCVMDTWSGGDFAASGPVPVRIVVSTLRW